MIEDPSRPLDKYRGCIGCMAVGEGEATLLGVIGALLNGANLELMRLSMCVRHQRAIDVVIVELRLANLSPLLGLGDLDN